MGKGPLSGVKIIEMAGIGPGPSVPCCCQIWALILSASTAKAGRAVIRQIQIVGGEVDCAGLEKAGSD